MDQVAKHGTGKLAIRGVAAELGLAPNALYRYFHNLAALQAALADESRSRLLAVLKEAADGKPPEAAIRGIAEAYLRFAREHPQVFSLTLRAGSDDNDHEPSHSQSWKFTSGHVARLYGDARAPEATVALWAFLHGMTALESAGVFGEIKPASGFEFGLQMWILAASRPAS
ncbi:TetR/AcrR family transcriptional regulator [Paraburkholderia sp. SIMBA_053]|uniref:TetR/AcrR family transcriptional regulator n=1 Tax=Paraburkholderia sp. SIMBA_053 TaxID=3085794 RepID=UPI0039780CC5